MLLDTQLPIDSRDLFPIQLPTSVFSDTLPPHTHKNGESVEKERERKIEREREKGKNKIM